MDDATLFNVLSDIREEAYAKGYKVPASVVGRSMLPLLRTHDVVMLTRPVPLKIRPGDVIIFRSRRFGLTGHRVIRKILRRGRIYFVTKGDANFRYDKPVPSKAVVGKIFKIMNRKGFGFSLERGIGRVINTAALFFSVTEITPVLVHFAIKVWNRRRR